MMNSVSSPQKMVVEEVMNTSPQREESNLKENGALASPGSTEEDRRLKAEQEEEEKKLLKKSDGVDCDLSVLRGAKADTTLNTSRVEELKDDGKSQEDLDALAELLPELKTNKENTGETELETKDGDTKIAAIPKIDSMHVSAPLEEEEEPKDLKKIADPLSPCRTNEIAEHSESSSDSSVHEAAHAVEEDGDSKEQDESDSDSNSNSTAAHTNTSDKHVPYFPEEQSVEPAAPPRHNFSSTQSLSTATQTHDVRIPMFLPTFRPATGCTNASDFIVRCFVARLRAGITVVKHGRSRWCKSRLRILHVHSDGRSLSWKPAIGEPSSSKRPPKLELSTCLEVRHAWSPDPQNTMFTGTPILRQKCEAANAHKSFALIFPKRTVDITAVTADQCRVLMEGFSALCFRLHVANLAKAETERENDDRTTASNTLTNNSNILPTKESNTKPSKSRR